MTKILKKSLACLLAFVLCFTAIAGCLAVSAEAPAITVGSLDLYVERPSNPNSPHPEVCEGERIRLQFGMGDLVKGTTMGIKILMPDGLTTEDIDVAGWHSSPAGIKIVSKYLDPETRWFTMVVNVTSDGNWNFYVRFDATANIPKDAVYGVYAEIEAATTSATGDENIFTHKTNTRPMRVMTSHNVVTDDAVAATCEGTGLTEGSHCSRCEKVLVAQEEVKALGHAYDEGKVDPDATCTSDGVITYTCKNDASHTYTEAISAKGHTAADALVDNKDGTHSEVCGVCGAKLSTAEHDFTNGDCACGATEEVADPLENANIIFNTLSVKVGETIGLNIRVNKSASVNLYNKNYIVKVAITTTGFDGTTFMEKEATTKYATLLKTTSSRFELEYTGIGMYEFTCPIDCVIEVYDKEPADGGVLIARSPKNTIKVADKLAATLSQVENAIPTAEGDTKANYIKQATMLSDLLNMGAAAQQLFASENYYPNSDLANTEKYPLANAGLTLNYASAELDLSTLNQENNVVVENAYKHNSFANQTSCSIKLNPGPNFKYRYLNGISTSSKLSMEVTYVNSVKTNNDPTYPSLYDLSEAVSVSGKNTTCYFSNIAFYDAGQTVTVRLYEGDSKNLVLTHTYSMESYIYAKLSDTVSPQALKDFCAAFGKFGKSANAFF